MSKKVAIRSTVPHSPWAGHRRLWHVTCRSCSVQVGTTWTHEIATAIAGAHLRSWHS